MLTGEYLGLLYADKYTGVPGAPHYSVKCAPDHIGFRSVPISGGFGVCGVGDEGENVATTGTVLHVSYFVFHAIVTVFMRCCKVFSRGQGGASFLFYLWTLVHVFKRHCVTYDTCARVVGLWVVRGCRLFAV